jgi:YVTN family beta-propeller protein
VIATASNTVVETIPMGVESFPNGVAIGPSGNYAYVTNTEDGTVSVIERASNTVVQTVTVGPSPIGVATTGDGKFVYVVNHGSNSVSVIAKGNPPAPGKPPSFTVVATINGVGTLPLSVAISRQ